MIRKRAREARGEVLPAGPPPTWEELEQLMREADAKAARALATIRGLETKKATR
jgi:hypothetical protein